MATEITLRLVYNTKTGKKDLFIDLESEDDALPIEHEQHHRSIVEQILGRGIVQATELGEVVVTRQSPQAAPAPQQGEASAEGISNQA